MPVFLLGDSGVPFDRTFFNVALDGVLEKGGGPDGRRLTLFLTDGATLDVSQIEELTGSYMTVRAFRGESTETDPALHVIPYGLIYRVEVAPQGGDQRVGFRHTAGTRAMTRGKRKGS